MSYDQEFEAFWKKYEGTTSWKEKAYDVWQAAKAPPQMEVKPLELEGGNWFIDVNNRADEAGSIKGSRDSGRERKNRELAEAASEKMRKRDRLHAFATEHCGYEYEWKQGEVNCYLYFYATKNEYRMASDENSCVYGTIYMPRETAEYLCAALNDGRLIL